MKLRQLCENSLIHEVVTDEDIINTYENIGYIENDLYVLVVSESSFIIRNKENNKVTTIKYDKSNPSNLRYALGIVKSYDLYNWR